MKKIFKKLYHKIYIFCDIYLVLIFSLPEDRTVNLRILLGKFISQGRLDGYLRVKSLLGGKPEIDDLTQILLAKITKHDFEGMQVINKLLLKL